MEDSEVSIQIGVEKSATSSAEVTADKFKRRELQIVMNRNW